MCRKKATLNPSDKEMEEIMANAAVSAADDTPEINEEEIEPNSGIEEEISNAEKEHEQLVEEMKAKVVEVKPTLTLTDSEGNQTVVPVSPAQLKAMETVAETVTAQSITLEEMLNELKKEQPKPSNYVSVQDLIKELKEAK